MSLEAITWAFKKTNLAPPQKLVLLVLANYADESQKAWPSFNTIAKLSGLARRTVVYHINNLEEVGAIKKVGVTDFQSNIYEINFEWTGAPDALPSARDALDDEEEECKSCTTPVQQMHQGSATDAPVLVQEMHPPSARDAPNTKVDTKIHTKVDTKVETKEMLEFFETAWKKYPATNKGSKTTAEEKFLKLTKKNHELPEKILHAIADQHTEYILKQRYGHWCPEWKHFITWLNQACWKNETNLNEEFWRNAANQRSHRPIKNSGSNDNRPKSKTEIMFDVCAPGAFAGTHLESKYRRSSD